MKTRIKKLISVNSIPLLVLALLIVLGPAWAAGRYPVSGCSKEVVFDLSTGEGKGPVSLTIGGKLYNGTVSVHMGKAVERGGGVLHFYGVKHTFDFGDDEFYTTGDEILTPTNDKSLYNLSGHMAITGGTEGFERADGRLSVRGELDLSTELASFEVNGAMSF